MNKKIPNLPKKLLVIMTKLLCHEIGKERYISDEDIKNAISPMGIEIDSAEEITFLYELLKLNYDNYKNLNENNIVFPELKKLKVSYYELRVETVKRIYRHEIESYSENLSLIDDAYFRNSWEYEDGIEDVFMTRDEDEEYIDGEVNDSGINKIEIIK